MSFESRRPQLGAASVRTHQIAMVQGGEDSVMRSRFSRLALATILTVLLSSVSAHVPLRPPGSIDVLVDLSVDGAAYEVNGPGECNYAADASIDGAPARMWSVRRHDTNEDRQSDADHLAWHDAG